MRLRVRNSISGKKEDFIPIDPNKVKMYVCGPTVYDIPHVGNIRSAVVYDVIFRVFKHFFADVIYVRNITDVDDKIIQAAESQGKSTKEIATFYECIFHEHLKILNCLEPTFQPRATESIDAIINMIKSLLKCGSAYVSDDHVYFDITSFKNYGKLSGKKLEDLSHGARIEVNEAKKNPGDFVLWKPDKKTGWDSPWGVGRPGWHIECSAMSFAKLGADFDLHGGGTDLKFPHHENEIAQSCCANPGSNFAKYWVHNGFLTVNGSKMSKSLGNVLNIDKLIESGLTPNIIRIVLISTHYAKPLNWCDDSIKDATNILVKFKFFAHGYSRSCAMPELQSMQEYKDFFDYICDDFNLPGAFSVLHRIVDKGSKNAEKHMFANLLIFLLDFLGLDVTKKQVKIDEDFVNLEIEKRQLLRKSGNYEKADLMRKNLEKIGVFIKDNKIGKATWICL